jgi:NADP-dependent 3-hydroxy acid dehydrogenase YdfG
MDTMGGGLADQVALIAGAGSGIGRACAIALAEAGARVVLLGRTREKLEQTRALLGAGAERAIVAPCDVSDRPRVAETVATVLASAGAIDILVCSAGINVSNRSLRALDPADWDRVVGTNLTGTFNLIHAVLPAMRERSRGLIIQIASISALRASALSGAAYSASKFGQAALGVCIGREERGRGIRSCVLFPGEVNTAFLESRLKRPDTADPGQNERMLQPEDVAAAVRFVAELPPRATVPQLVLMPALSDFF